MFVRLELRDLLLPVCIEDIAVVARQTLIDLQPVSARCFSHQHGRVVHSATSQ
jgi:hypothetical protein